MSVPVTYAASAATGSHASAATASAGPTALRTPPASVTTLGSTSAAALAASASRTFFRSADVAIVFPAEDVGAQAAAARVAEQQGVPLLLGGDGAAAKATVSELDRLDG